MHEQSNAQVVADAIANGESFCTTPGTLVAARRLLGFEPIDPKTICASCGRELTTCNHLCEES